MGTAMCKLAETVLPRPPRQPASAGDAAEAAEPSPHAAKRQKTHPSDGGLGASDDPEGVKLFWGVSPARIVNEGEWVTFLEKECLIPPRDAHDRDVVAFWEALRAVPLRLRDAPCGSSVVVQLECESEIDGSDDGVVRTTWTVTAAAGAGVDSAAAGTGVSAFVVRTEVARRKLRRRGAGGGYVMLPKAVFGVSAASPVVTGSVTAHGAAPHAQ